MRRRSLGTMFLGVGSALLLGGCATVPRYSYYQVPCGVPGAVPASPVAGPGQIPATPGGAPVDATAGQSPSTCIIAVSERGYGGYDGAYYPRYRNYGYGLGGYGSSFGIGIGLGSRHHHHSSRGHHGGHRRH